MVDIVSTILNDLSRLQGPTFVGLFSFICGYWFGGIFTSAKSGQYWGAIWRIFMIFLIAASSLLDQIMHARMLELCFLAGAAFAMRPFITSFWNWSVDLISAVFRVAWQIVGGAYRLVESIAMLAARIVSYGKHIPHIKAMGWRESRKAFQGMGSGQEPSRDQSHTSDDFEREQARRADEMRREYERRAKEAKRKDHAHDTRTQREQQGEENKAEQERRNAAQAQAQREREEREASERRQEQARKRQEEQNGERERDEAIRRTKEADKADPTKSYDAAVEYFGLDPNGFTKEDLKRAHKEKTLALHPDKWAGLPEHIRKVFEDEAKKINAARDLIRNIHG